MELLVGIGVLCGVSFIGVIIWAAGAPRELLPAIICPRGDDMPAMICNDPDCARYGCRDKET